MSLSMDMDLLVSDKDFLISDKDVLVRDMVRPPDARAERWSHLGPRARSDTDPR